MNYTIEIREKLQQINIKIKSKKNKSIFDGIKVFFISVAISFLVIDDSECQERKIKDWVGDSKVKYYSVGIVGIVFIIIIALIGAYIIGN